MTVNNYNIMPMVGSGKRFQNEGYLTLKPLIKVNQKTIAGETLLAKK